MDWLSGHIHRTNRDEEIPGIHMTINAIGPCMDIPDCMTTEEISSVITESVSQSCLTVSTGVLKDLQPYEMKLW